MNLFHAYVWLAGQSNKAFDEKSWDPSNLFHSQKWMQQSILWIYFMPLYDWKKQWAFDRKSWKLSKLILLHSQKWMQQHFIYIFMIVIVIFIMDMVIKKISKTHFDEKSWDPPNLLHSQKWMQQSILWIYFMSLYDWKKQWAFDRKSWNWSKLVLLHSQKWMQ